MLAVSGILASLILVIIVGGLDPPDADIKYDWLSAKGALESNAYDDILDLAEESEVPVRIWYSFGSDRPFSHPRTPAAVLLALPLLLLSYGHLYTLTLFVNVVLLAIAIDRAAHRNFNLVGLTLLSILSIPVLSTLRFGGQAGVVAWLALVAWVQYDRRRYKSAGIVLAVAISLKVFPLALLFPMVLRRRFLTPITTGLTFLALNTVGLMLPGVALDDAVGALMGALDRWIALPSNGSIAGVLVRSGIAPFWAQIAGLAVVALVLVFGIRFRRESLFEDPLPWLLLALVALPISWVSYDVVLLPAALALLTAPHSRLKLGLGIWGLWIGATAAWLGLFSVGSDHVVNLGAIALLACLAMLVAWWIGEIRWVRGDRQLWRPSHLAGRHL